MKTIALIALVALVSVVVIALVKAVVVCYYQSASGLVEDYEDCKDDVGFLAEYDSFLNSKNPLCRWMVKVHDMKAVREGKFANGDI